ncbi:MAG TPA: hypothetical protein VMW50_08220 [Dehalococcoidia bacterium]|nr:hypothetical protein [Dehalococcoidia bacterium]
MGRPKGSKNKKKKIPPCPELKSPAKKKPAKKQELTGPEAAEYYKTVFIARFGGATAGRIARLLYEKITASNKYLEDKYNEASGKN